MRCHVTLTFDLLTSKVDRFIALPIDRLCQFAANAVHSFSKYRIHKFGDKRINERTDGRTDGQTNRTCEEVKIDMFQSLKLQEDKVPFWCQTFFPQLQQSANIHIINLNELTRTC